MGFRGKDGRSVSRKIESGDNVSSQLGPEMLRVSYYVGQR